MLNAERLRQHRMIDIDALGLPLHDAPNHEGVPQIMDARRMMGAPVAPVQPSTQFIEDTMHLAAP
jgi:hypothetical protein